MRAHKRILFVAEAVTLAHLARPLALAQALDDSRYESILACAPRYATLIGDRAPPLREIYSISNEQFLERLARGRPVYDIETLRRYARDDLALIDEVRPDLIVGDFRLSLSVSARVAGIPYMAITNAYWSPYVRQRIPLPEHPSSRILGLSGAEAVFRVVHPLAFALHCIPLNRLRREYGLPSLGSSLFRVYTDADITLYADVPEAIPVENCPAHHVYLGPVLWSPPVPLPVWWSSLPRDRPLVYVCLGSSGRRQLLGSVLESLSAVACTVAAATAGQPLPSRVPSNVNISTYLPGDAVIPRASLVICNGGSPTSQQALAAGVPVLGLASNLDQFLNMAAVERLGAGRLLRAERATSMAIREAATTILGQPGYAAAAHEAARIFGRYQAHDRFASMVAAILGTARSAVVPTAPEFTCTPAE